MLQDPVSAVHRFALRCARDDGCELFSRIWHDMAVNLRLRLSWNYHQIFRVWPRSARIMCRLYRYGVARYSCEGAFMAGSWREILESAGVDEVDAKGSVRPGEAHRDAESQGGEPPSPVQLHPTAGPRGFDEPELSAFLTRLASPPDAGPAALAEDGPASARRKQARGREGAPGNSLVVAVGAAKAPAPVEAAKSAPPAGTPPPVARERRPWRGRLATSLLAATAGLSAYALSIPGGNKPDTSQSPSLVEASRVRVETPAVSHRARALRGRHKRTAAGREGALSRCAYDPDRPVCRWRRFRDR